MAAPTPHRSPSPSLRRLPEASATSSCPAWAAPGCRRPTTAPSTSPATSICAPMSPWTTGPRPTPSWCRSSRAPTSYCSTGPRDSSGSASPGPSARRRPSTRPLPLPVADGDRLQVRATIDIDAAARNTKVTFWYRTDVTADLTNSTGWTQLGAVVTRNGAVAIANGANPVSLGAGPDGASPWAGDFYQAAIFSGIGGTPVAALDLRTPAQATDPRTSRTGRTAAGRSGRCSGRGGPTTRDPQHRARRRLDRQPAVGNGAAHGEPQRLHFDRPGRRRTRLRLGPRRRWAVRRRQRARQPGAPTPREPTTPRSR